MRYGWVPDTLDHRDRRMVCSVVHETAPVFADLRPYMPPVYDQGSLGSCTANAIAGAIEYDFRKQNRPIWTPSRLFIYYNERVLEHTVSIDAGAQIRDGIKTINKWGVCHESRWPYVTSRFATSPPPSAYGEALLHTSLEYSRVDQTNIGIKACIAHGYPVIFGFSVFADFESEKVASSGILPMPGVADKPLGGHAVLIVGYNSGPIMVNGIPPGHFLVRNSWGSDWGMHGYFAMPQDYVLSTRYADDFWSISVMK